MNLNSKILTEHVDIPVKHSLMQFISRQIVDFWCELHSKFEA